VLPHLASVVIASVDAAGPIVVIHDDLPAVEHAITSPYSSGVNEGRITDVKLQKRLMAGRAHIPLLRQRVILIAHLRRDPNAKL
jgi:transposase